MAGKFYAWSVIQYDADVDESGASIKHKRVPFGEEVTKSKLKVTDEDWQELLAAGSVRDKKPPDMPDTWQGSPVEYLRAQAAEAAEGTEAAAMSMGGSYFGPNTEDILMDPEESGLPEGVEEVK